ncbi:restriction endonuclease subunit S domain-containing protein, partial [Aquipseudomonas alcaligenes]
MTFPVYLAYKDSGVEWLGEVPEHWAVHPLKRAIERIESGTSVNAADFPAEPGSLGVLKTSCVYTGKFDWAENKTVNDEDLSRVSCPLRKDTLIVSRMNTPDLVGATGLVTEAPNGIFLPDRLWQVYFLVNHSPEFLFYFSKSREYREQVKMACSGTSASMQNLGQDDFRGLLFAEPPKPEQTKIARFLDHETARIDALIEEQQRLIELLKEKRQAVISHAVTKGLDPTLPMKDSGVKWLGDVPVHWRVGNIKYFLEAIGDVDHYMPQSVDKGIPYVMTGDLMELVSDIQFEECKQVAYDDYLRLSGRIKTSKGDVVMARYATIGSVSYVDIDAEFLVSYSCVTIKPDLSKVLGIYLFYYFKSDSFLNGIRARTNTNTQG